jgi:trk system potassium uptake protein
MIGFVLLIGTGTLLLRLPFATTMPGSIPWIDALFTATSAVTVTGLTVLTTGEDFTLFGQIVILMLLQVGGVGFITISMVLFQIAGLHVGIQERFLLQQTLGSSQPGNVLRLAANVLVIVLFLEMIGAVLLFLRWVQTMEPGEAAYYAVFHAMSAFCNAGFDLFGGTEHTVLFGYGQDPFTLTVLAVLILIGALGVLVMDDLLTWPRDRRLSVHTKLTLSVTGITIVVGIVVLLLDEGIAGTLLGLLPAEQQFFVGAFTIISGRTAGFTILPIEQVSTASQLLILVWMFIGGAPSSMASGVSTSTVGVIAAAMLATVRSQPQTVIFGRAILMDTILKAMAVMTVSTLVVVVVSIVLGLMRVGDMFAIGFETVSAFANNGYSMGISGQLPPSGRLLYAFIMFWGRLGPLALVVILAQRRRPSMVTYPHERLILG